MNPDPSFSSLSSFNDGEEDGGYIVVLDRVTDRLLGGYVSSENNAILWVDHQGLGETELVARSSLLRQRWRLKYCPLIPLFSPYPLTNKRFDSALISVLTLRSLSLPVRTLTITPSTNTSSIITLLSSCRILIGSHGAGLTHAMWLPRNAVLIEVITRTPLYYGYPNATRGYHKSDFANLARAFGVRYYYKDSLGYTADRGDSFNWGTSVLDVGELGEQVRRVWDDLV